MTLNCYLLKNQNNRAYCRLNGKLSLFKESVGESRLLSLKASKIIAQRKNSTVYQTFYLVSFTRVTFLLAIALSFGTRSAESVCIVCFFKRKRQRVTFVIS